MNKKIIISNLKCIDKNINLDNYINFSEKIKKSMEYPNWLGNFEKEDLENMLKDGTKIWMYYLGEEPICSMMLIPATEKSLNKFEIDVNHDEVVEYGPMIVNPNYLGNKLQYQMLQKLDNYSYNEGYKYAVSTIHPDNIFSINNFLEDNFEFISRKEFKRGIRNIYIKNLNKR